MEATGQGWSYRPTYEHRPTPKGSPAQPPERKVAEREQQKKRLERLLLICG